MIPRRVKHDDTVCADQVDAQVSGSSGNKEQKNFWIGVEFIHQFLSVQAVFAAIHPKIRFVFRPTLISST